MATITRDQIIAELGDYQRIASRLTIADEEYPVVHAILNQLLDELEETPLQEQAR
ncbi:MAG: hypothetical protein ACTHOK_04490 [Nocardioidaceae bacterium]